MPNERERFARIEQKLEDMDNRFTEKLDSIEAQTKITNGRVGAIETWKIQHVATMEATREERKNHKAEHEKKRDWSNKKTAIIIAILGLAFTLIQMYLSYVRP